MVLCLRKSLERASAPPGRRWLGVLSALTIVVTLAPESARSAENDQKQVLVVYSTRRDTQAAIVGDREMPGLLERGLKAKVDYYSEHIDLARFADSQYEAAFRDYLELK